ncbi:hypothetical protein [Bacillus sp. JCM 19034]|uniref:hypothetical protein n=1 Tax=Bacillus sp. JCM 19034 TaxID=1481928 RepID=UPI000782EA03|nr:hypothetical protein [Bacillus sp. JCM 19034]
MVAGSDEEGYLVFERSFEGDSVVIGLNTNEEVSEVTFATPFTEKAVDLYSGAVIEVENGQVTVDLPSMADGGTVILAQFDQEIDQPKQPTPGQPKPEGDQEKRTPPVNNNNDVDKDKIKDQPTTSPVKETDETHLEVIGETDEGEVLPITATNVYQWLLVGMFLVAIGITIMGMKKE